MQACTHAHTHVKGVHTGTHIHLGACTSASQGAPACDPVTPTSPTDARAKPGWGCRQSPGPLAEGQGQGRVGLCSDPLRAHWAPPVRVEILSVLGPPSPPVLWWVRCPRLGGLSSGHRVGSQSGHPGPSTTAPGASPRACATDVGLRPLAAVSHQERWHLTSELTGPDPHHLTPSSPTGQPLPFSVPPSPQPAFLRPRGSALLSTWAHTCLGTHLAPKGGTGIPPSFGRALGRPGLNCPAKFSSCLGGRGLPRRPRPSWSLHCPQGGPSV